MIHVRYFRLRSPESFEPVHRFLPLLPAAMKPRILRFVFAKDAQLSLFGKILLNELLSIFGYPLSILSHIQQTAHGRPFLNQRIDFNISHSGDMVIAAASDTHRLGIDIEQIRPIQYSDFTHYFSEPEMACIHESSDPHRQFFSFWTQKEALIKLDGRGLGVPLEEVILKSEQGYVQQNKWHLRELPLGAQYIGFLATDIRIDNKDLYIEESHIYEVAS